MFCFWLLVLLLAPQEVLNFEPVPDGPATNRRLEMDLLPSAVPEVLSQTPQAPASGAGPMFAGRKFWGNVIGVSSQEADTPNTAPQPVPSANLVPRTEVQTLTGHTGPVETIAFSTDYRRLFSGGADRQVILWDVSSGVPLRKYLGNRAAITSLAVSKNGKNFVSCSSSDRRVLLWGTDAEVPLEELPAPPSEPNAVAINSDATQIVVGLSDGQITLYQKTMDPPAFQRITFKGHSLAVNHVRFSPDEKSFLSCGSDRTVIVWNVQTRRPIQVFRKHQGAVLCADFSPNGEEIVSVGMDKTALVWAIADGEIRHRLPGHVGDITAVAFSADGSEICTASKDRTILVWDAKTGAKKAVSPIRNSQILAAQWNEVNKSIAISSTNGTVEILASSVFIPEDNTTDDSTGHSLSVPNFRQSFFSGTDSEKRKALMELPSGQVVFRYGRTSHYSDVGTISPNGLQFASVNTNRGEGTLWETDTGKVALLLNSPQQISAVCFHTKDSNFLLTGSRNGMIRYWNLSQNNTSDLPGHESPVQAIAVAPNGTQFLTGEANGTIIFWDIRTRQKLQTLRTDQKKIRSLVFSPDGKRFAISAEDRAIGLWTNNGEEENLFTEQKLIGHDSGEISVAFSPDGAYLYSAASDGKAIQWEVATGKPLKEFKAHTDGIASVAVSPNGQYLLTGGKSEEFSLLWDVNTAEPVMILPFQGGPVTNVLFHPKSLNVITVGGRTPLLWSISELQNGR